MSVLEALGRGVGGILAPVAAEASLVRGAAVLHADGVVVRAEVTAIAAPDPLGALGEALGGPALVRFSNALRRARPGRDPRDVLGAAVRFRAGTDRPQDLLFATFLHAWQAPSPRSSPTRSTSWQTTTTRSCPSTSRARPRRSRST